MTIASSSFRTGLARVRRARARGLTAALAAVLVLATGACSDAPSAPSTAPSLDTPGRAVASAQGASSLLECALAPVASASRLITPAGGLLAVGGNAIAIPRGAVRTPVRITMTVPASKYVEVNIEAAGIDHYQFRRPVVVTLDYSRCGASADAMGSSFTAWYVDGSTRALFADMGGVDDRFSRRIIFTTDHLSGYAVAYRAGNQEQQPDAQ